jgi:hypothetical protein
VVLDRPAISESLLIKVLLVLEQFPFSFLTKDKLATKLVNEGNKLPIAFILALLAKNLIAKRKTICFFDIGKTLLSKTPHQH